MSEPGPVALITGATGGLGRAIAQRLAAEGCRLGLLARDQTRLQGLALDLSGLTECILWAGDVREPSDLLTLRTACLQEWQRVDLLVCAHGAAPATGPSLEVTRWTWKRLHDIDVYGTFLACQVAAEPMRAAGGGAIVLLTSLHALQSYPERAAYASAKAAVGGFVRSLALEWGPWGITVNAVAPWQVAGARTDRFVREAKAQGVDLLAAYVAKSPLRRLILPEEVADAVLFLAKNRGLTGQTLVLDAGVSASMWYAPFAEISHGQRDTHAGGDGIASHTGVRIDPDKTDVSEV